MVGRSWTGEVVTGRIASGFDITPHTVIEEDPIPFFSFLSCRYVSVCRD